MSTLKSSEVGQVKNIQLVNKSRSNQELNNPCLKEHKLSLKCLNDNGYKSEKCKIYFQNYNNCKSFWAKVTYNRRLHGISPYLPLPEERDKIRAEYLNSQKK